MRKLRVRCRLEYPGLKTAKGWPILATFKIDCCRPSGGSRAAVFLGGVE